MGDEQFLLFSSVSQNFFLCNDHTITCYKWRKKKGTFDVRVESVCGAGTQAGKKGRAWGQPSRTMPATLTVIPILTHVASVSLDSGPSPCSPLGSKAWVPSGATLAPPTARRAAGARPRRQGIGSSFKASGTLASGALGES